MSTSPFDASCEKPPPYDCYAFADPAPARAITISPQSKPAPTRPTPKPRLVPTANPPKPDLSLDAEQLPAKDLAFMVRFLNLLTGRVERMITERIMTAPLGESIETYLFAEFFADKIPIPGSIHFQNGKFRIPFRDDGQEIPTEWLPALVGSALYTPHFQGVIHFGPAMAFGLRATASGEVILYGMDDVTLEAYRGGVRHLTTLAFALSDGKICAQATLDPPFDRSKSGPQTKYCITFSLTTSQREQIVRATQNMDQQLGFLSPLKWLLKVAAQ